MENISADEMLAEAKENIEENPSLALEQALTAAALYYSQKQNPKVRESVNLASKAMNPLVGQDALWLMTCSEKPSRESVLKIIEENCGHYRKLRDMYRERKEIDPEAAKIFDQASFEFKRKVMQRYSLL